MRHMSRIFFICALILTATGHGLAQEPLRLYDISTRKVVTLNNIVHRLGKSRIVLVGEHHNEPDHHRAQLQIIRSLANNGIPVVVGLEMFRSDSQEALDRWVASKISERDFQQIYRENWSFPWALYRDIFAYAKENKVPLVGLNVPRDITQQVARRGFHSLAPEQKGLLPFIECKVDPEYMEFIRRAHGTHAHGRMSFEYFCEAQLVWDKSMAIHAIEYLNSRPGFTMVLLAGTAHVWKKAIPAQLEQSSFAPYTVILPEAPGSIERSGVTLDDADYLILGPAKAN